MPRNALTLAAAAAILTAGCAGPLMRNDADLAQRSVVAPSPTVAVVLSRDAALRTAPDAAAPATASLSSGLQATASEQVTRGHRRVRTADGRTGWVDAAALATPGAAAGAAGAVK